MADKPFVPKGTRDFGPEQMNRRNYIFRTIRKVFELYGYQPIETPAMESLETLLGKYGEEGDRLIFRILNSGDFLKKTNLKEIDGSGDDSIDKSKKLAPRITEKALRYDLTVPFARFVVQHRNDLTLPFKRYQIQPVWRADRPQKGRYREFYQCDVDVIGSESLLNEAELIRIIDEVFTRLNIRVTVKINNRKVLSGIAEMIGQADRLIDITVAIDKIDKIGLEGVTKELAGKGIEEKDIEAMLPIITLEGSNQTKLEKLAKWLKDSESGIRGVEELTEMIDLLTGFELTNPVEIDLSLARGLNYYTGAIVEVKSTDVSIGSICGGGRYDNLTGVFGMPGISGVGVSFGADRIYDVLHQTEGFPSSVEAITEILFLNFGPSEVTNCLKQAEALRIAGFRTEVYPESVKMKKQMQYANQNKIPLVAFFGEEEQANKQITIKEMKSGEQVSVSLDQMKEQISQWIR